MSIDISYWILLYVIDALNMLQSLQRREALCRISMRWPYLCGMQSGDASRNGVVVLHREDCLAQIYSTVLVRCGIECLNSIDYIVQHYQSSEYMVEVVRIRRSSLRSRLQSTEHPSEAPITKPPIKQAINHANMPTCQDAKGPINASIHD